MSAGDVVGAEDVLSAEDVVSLEEVKNGYKIINPLAETMWHVYCTV